MATAEPTHARGRRALLVLSLAVTSSTLLVRLADMDLFSHIAVGRWMAATHELPRHDPFSYASGGVFRYTEALADLIFHLVDRAGGAVGLGLLQVAAGLGLLALVVLRAPGSAPARALVAALVITGSFAAMTLKPQLFSYLLFAGVLLFLERATAKNPRRLLLVPLAFLAWANLHRGGVFGLAVLAAVAVGWGLRATTRKHAAYLLVATALSALALLVNVGGVYYYTSAFDVVGRASFHARIDEWRPLTPAVLGERHLAIVALALLAIGERALRRRTIDTELLVLALSLALATKGARLLPFVAIAAAPAAVRAVEAIRARVAVHARPVFVDALAFLAAFLLPLVHYERSVPPAYRGLGVSEAMVPTDLVRFLAANRPSGHLFHSFNLGGYFVYWLAPETKVLIDGRNDTVYDDALFEDVFEAEVTRAAFTKLDARFEFAVAAFRVAQLDDARGAFLSGDPDWALVWWDDLSVVYAHRLRAPEMTARFGYHALRVSDAPRRAEEPRPGADDALFIEELRRNAREAVRSSRAHYLLAVALATRGMGDEARAEAATFQALAREKGAR